MTPRAAGSLDQTFLAFADRTRRAILARLMQGDARVTEVAAPFDISLNAVSKHVRMLERAGLVGREIRGRDHLLSFHGEPLEEAGECFDEFRRFWEERLDALEKFLRSKKLDKTRKSKRKPS